MTGRIPRGVPNVLVKNRFEAAGTETRAIACGKLAIRDAHAASSMQLPIEDPLTVTG